MQRVSITLHAHICLIYLIIALFHGRVFFTTPGRNDCSTYSCTKEEDCVSMAGGSICICNEPPKSVICGKDLKLLSTIGTCRVTLLTDFLWSL